MLSTGSVIWLAMQPTLRVLIITSLGAVLGWRGIVDKSGRRAISGLTFNLLVPSVIITNVGSTVSPTVIREWWPLPVNSLLTVLVGGLLAMVLNPLLRIPHNFRRHFFLLSSLGNIGTIPLVLLPALVRESPDTFGGLTESQAQAYAVVSAWLWFWLGSSLLNVMLEDCKTSGQLPSSGQHTTTASGGSGGLWVVTGGGAGGSAVGCVQGAKTATKQRLLLGEDDQGGVRQGMGEERGQGSVVRGVLLDEESEVGPEEQLHVVVDTGDQSGAVTGQDGSAAARIARLGARTSSLPEAAPPRGPLAYVRVAWVRSKQFRDNFLHPPAIAVLVATVVAMAGPLQRALYSPPDPTPLQFASDSIRVLAQAVVPGFLIPLGATLAEGPKSSSLPTRVVVALVVTKLLLAPLVGSSIVFGLWKAGVIPVPDRLFLMQLLAAHALPSANLVHNVASQKRNLEAEVGQVLFYQYLASLLQLPVALLVYLTIVQDLELVVQ